VDVLATVLNRATLVADLTENDSNSVTMAPQTIKYFSRQSDIPLRIGLLLDTSTASDRIKLSRKPPVNFLTPFSVAGKDQPLP